jgi:hypothetical protein
MDVVADRWDGDPAAGALVICQGWLVGRAR